MILQSNLLMKIYLVHFKCNIFFKILNPFLTPEGSVFKVPVQSEVDASKVTASGPGVDPENCRAAASLPFKVNAKRSAKAPLEVQVTSDKGVMPQKPEITDNKDGTYSVNYVPPPEGSKCDVKVTYGGKDIVGRYDIKQLIHSMIQ